MKIGLTDKEVVLSQNKYGNNITPPPKRRTIFNFIIESFGDPIIKILLIALAIKIVFMFKDFNWYETLGILIAIFLATLISTLSEYGSENAFKKLQEQNKDVYVKTYRNNILTNIKSSELVVGDVIILESGDIIPADSKILKGNILVDESMLTGESKLEEKKYISNKETKLYKGTICYEGTCNALITSVGINTLYGTIAKEINDNKSISPLKKRLIHLSKIINKIGYIGALLVAFSYLFSVIVIANNFNRELIIKYITNKSIINDLIYALTLSVTTIVVAVPEGLPMMITLVLSSNMKRLVKDNVLVRKMVGIESAGNINYLLTDKTGTITKGKLEVIYYVSGDLHKYNFIDDIKNKEYKDIILESLIYNSSSYISNNNVIGGNSTDKSIYEYLKNNIYQKNKNYNYIPFNSDTKYSEVYIGNHHYIKGAYDKLISLCDYYIDHNNHIKKINNINLINNYINSLTTKGLRVIANIDKYENKVIFLGLVVIKDVIRKESIEGIKRIDDAGINIIMITGDHNDTALSIAKEVGIFKSDSISLTSEEFNDLSFDELHEIINKVKVISRALPSDKSRLVRLLQDKGNIVGMTGDGVNDAPALKKSDASFAMGSGTSVAKEASDIVILDNNLLSISKAILFGRTIFKSIRKFISYQLSVNFCALTLSVIGPFIGISAPITIVQMLWLNMIMDTFAGLAFSFEPSLDKYLKEKPLNQSEPVINKNMYIEIITNGLYSAFLCLLYLKLPIIKHIVNNNHKHFMTSYFALFIFLGIFNAFSCRTSSINIFKDINKNKRFLFIFIFIFIAQIVIIYYGGSIFGTYGISVKDLLFTLLLSSTTLIINSIRKIYIKKDFNPPR